MRVSFLSLLSLIAILQQLDARICHADDLRAKLQHYCADCHNADLAEGDLNFESLPLPGRPSDNAGVLQSLRRWTLVYDRIQRLEMPPADATSSEEEMPEKVRDEFLSQLARQLNQADRRDIQDHGRGPSRRLTRIEFENNLRDILKLPSLDIRDYLPEDRELYQSSKAAEALDLSRVQLAAYLRATDVALRAAMAQTIEPRTPKKYFALATSMFPKAVDHAGRESSFYLKHGRMVPLTNRDLADYRSGAKAEDPDFEVAIFRSAAWPYYGYPHGFLAEESGLYHVRFEARAVRQKREFRLIPAPASQAMTFRARQPSKADVSGDVRAAGGLIDVAPEGGVYETDILLKVGEVFEYSLLGLPVPHPITSHGGPLYYDFPPMTEGGHAGIAFRWLEAVGPIDSSTWPPPSHRVLFGDLPIREAKDDQFGPIVVESVRPKVDAATLLQQFALRAAQRPVATSELAVFQRLIEDQLEQGLPFHEAMLAGYRALLCSNHFLLLPEPSGQADQYAVAVRLAHLLTNSRPDKQLHQIAGRQELYQPAVLRAEVERLVSSDLFDRFVSDFVDQWLDLKDVKRDPPDIRLYPEYRGDDYLIESAERETLAFVATLFRENLPVTNLVASNFVMINDRLAKHYELPAVEGSWMRKVSLPVGSHRGGLLAQAALLKVTANGTTTSPILRGAWVMDRIMGQAPPPPPPDVPAVEPDLRGVTTIRAQLAKHAESETCGKCHALFDPVGLALEAYDVVGGFRARYRSLEKGDEVTGIDRAGHKYSYFVKDAIDTSGQLADGTSFRDLGELRQLLLRDTRSMARNVLQRLTIYATGTPVRFSERTAIEAILDRCQADGYRFRDLLTELVASPIVTPIVEPLEAAQ